MKIKWTSDGNFKGRIEFYGPLREWAKGTSSRVYAILSHENRIIRFGKQKTSFSVFIYSPFLQVRREFTCPIKAKKWAEAKLSIFITEFDREVTKHEQNKSHKITKRSPEMVS